MLPTILYVFELKVLHLVISSVILAATTTGLQHFILMTEHVLKEAKFEVSSGK